MCGSGVFRYIMIARAALSLFREPSAEVLFMMMRLALLTPNSARPFDWGYSAEEFLWLTPHCARNLPNSSDLNCGPPSELSSSGTPYVTNNVRNVMIMHLLVDWWGRTW